MTHARPSAQPAPRSPFGFVGRAGRAARALTTAASALTLAVGALTLAPAPAHAADPITTQEYFSYYHLDSARQKGYTGKGVTIAYIENAPDMNVPELQGANIEQRKTPCDFKPDPGLTSHSTTVASILGNKDWGWAPEAKIVNYTAHLMKNRDLPGQKCSDDPNTNNNVNAQINRALNDGVDIISLSVAGADQGEAAVMARAARLGVPIIAGADNTGTEQNVSYGALNTVVAVGATDLTGKRSDFSSYGDHLTIMAPGEGIANRQPDANGNLTEITTEAKGTSFSTPMVTGLLALGKQKWPNATGNQLIRSLINTANNNGQGWTKEYGWGLIDPVKFLTEDPTSLEDTNPLWEKIPDALPNQQTLADYQDGLTDPVNLIGDSSYVYRGVDDAIVANYPDISEYATSPRYHKK